jgi:hypothetical protein
MAIAIKKDAALSQCKPLADKCANEGRTAMKLTCPVSNCGQGYIVFFGTVSEESQISRLADEYIRLDHPIHQDVYAIKEPMPKW